MLYLYLSNLSLFSGNFFCSKLLFSVVYLEVSSLITCSFPSRPTRNFLSEWTGLFLYRLLHLRNKSRHLCCFACFLVSYLNDSEHFLNELVSLLLLPILFYFFFCSRLYFGLDSLISRWERSFFYNMSGRVAHFIFVFRRLLHLFKIE